MESRGAGHHIDPEFDWDSLSIGAKATRKRQSFRLLGAVVKYGSQFEATRFRRA